MGGSPPASLAHHRAWAIAAVLLTLLAPNIDKVSVNDQRAFLPTKAPSLDAARVLKEYFPERSTQSSAVVVLDAGTGRRVSEGEPWRFVGDLTGWLTGPAAPKVIQRVVSPTTADEMTAKALISADGQVALVLVNFTRVEPSRRPPPPWTPSRPSSPRPPQPPRSTSRATRPSCTRTTRRPGAA